MIRDTFRDSSDKKILKGKDPRLLIQPTHLSLLAHLTYLDALFNLLLQGEMFSNRSTGSIPVIIAHICEIMTLYLDPVIVLNV